MSGKFTEVLWWICLVAIGLDCVMVFAGVLNTSTENIVLFGAVVKTLWCIAVRNRQRIQG